MLIASGAVEHAQLVDAAEALFQRLPLGDGPPPSSRASSAARSATSSDLEQAHLAFAFPGVASTDPDAVTAQVFATALGGGMSSRLFQEAREKRGLCYAIYAFSQSHRDTGTIGVYAGTGEDKAGEVTPLIAAEIEAMAKDATEEEAARARAQLRASLLMALESPARALRADRRPLAQFRPRSLDKGNDRPRRCRGCGRTQAFRHQALRAGRSRDGVGRSGGPAGVARPLCAPLWSHTRIRRRLIHVHAGDDLSWRPGTGAPWRRHFPALPANVGLRRLGGAERRLPRVPGALGTHLGRRRALTLGVPPSHPPLSARDQERPVLPILRVPQDRQSSDGRLHAFQRAAWGHTVGGDRILDRRALTRGTDTCMRR